MTDRLTDEDLKRLCDWVAESDAAARVLGRRDRETVTKMTGLVSRLLSEVTDLREEVCRLQATHHDAAVIYGQVRAEALRAEALIAEIRAIVTAERQAFGRSAFVDALWETLQHDDAEQAQPPATTIDAKAENQAAECDQQGRALPTDVGCVAQTFSRTNAGPLVNWLGKD